MFPYFLKISPCAIFLQVIGASTVEKFIIVVLLIFIVITMFTLQKSRKSKAELAEKNRIIKKQSVEIADKYRILEEKNKKLQALNEEKNNLIGVVSHDLKAPLNRIFALSNLVYLSGENLTKTQKDYLEKMNQVVSEGLDLIRNLLDIRAIEFKGIQRKYEEVDLEKLLQNLIKTSTSAAAQKDQKISYINKYTEGPLVIESDKLYLTRIFDNLLSNAIKFSFKGTGIRVLTNKYEDGISVRIEDSGPGISSEDQKKLFQKFQVLSARPTGGEISTGFGLSITKSLVNILKGSIRYEPSPDGGSVFVVELPVLTHA